MELMVLNMSNLSSVANILEGILSFTASTDPHLGQCLQEGLSSEQINEMTQDFSFRLPREVEELYKWHNGMGPEGREDHRLLYYHYFLPLDEALDLSKSFAEIDFIEKKGLLPLFEFEGEYYASCCSEEEQELASICFLYHDEHIVYDSLTTMLSSILECYEQKAYVPVMCWAGEPNADEDLAAQIKLKWNPVRQRSGLGLCDHP